MSNEKVLVIPTSRLREVGHFQGFTPEADRYLSGLLAPEHMLYLDRAEAEQDPSYKQLIPYVVLRWGGEVFHYTRGASGTEKRLHALGSIGIGGHICSEDGDLSAAEDSYRRGMAREVGEEVHLESPYQERLLGLINDDRTPVGQVHLGIVHLFDLEEPRVRYREEALSESGFVPLSELGERLDRLETWSQLLLEGSWLSR